MTDEHVLSYLARRFAPSEENIATEALTWVLRRSAAAREAVIRLACAGATDLPVDLDFSGQVGEPETGRPDVVGADDQHRERLLIEAKFAAALTEHQPAGYLRRLPPGETGVLLVVAPQVRLASLWSELLAALPGDTPAPAPSSALPSEVPALQAAPGHWLVLTSWRRLVHAVLDAVRLAEEHRLVRDVEQLLSLTETMDARAFVPVRPGDLNQQIGRQVHQLNGLVTATYERLLAQEVIEDPRRRSSYVFGYNGWRVVSSASGKLLWFGFWPWAWAEHGASPLWAQVYVSEAWPRHRLQRALAAYGQPGQPGLFEVEDSFAVPLSLPALAGKQETVHSLAAQLRKLGERLAEAVPPGTAVVPEDPAVDEDAPEPDDAADDPTP